MTGLTRAARVGGDYCTPTSDRAPAGGAEARAVSVGIGAKRFYCRVWISAPLNERARTCAFPFTGS